MVYDSQKSLSESYMYFDKFLDNENPSFEHAQKSDQHQEEENISIQKFNCFCKINYLALQLISI